VKKNILCAFDLEMIANPDMVDCLPEVKPSGTLKDPVKIQADIEKKQAKQYADMGLNPHTNLICCASFQDVYTGEKQSFMLDEAEEGVLLCDIWEHLEPFQLFTSFNGMSFDIECLKFHSMVAGVKMSKIISQEKYRQGNHVDLRMVLSRNNDYAKGNQGYFCKLLFGEEKEIQGSEIQGLWDAGKFDKIKKHCEDDVEQVCKLYKKLEGYYI